MSNKIIKGFNEFVGAEAAKRAKIRKIILKGFELYGFEPTESPTLEFEEFVGKDASADTISEIFRLEDRGKRKLALRYESTFQLKRLAKNQKLPFKRYTFAQVFRDEPVGPNRFREISQCDCDVIGASLKDSAEVLSLVKDILDELGVRSVIYVNNRKLLNEIMVDLNVKEKNREQVIRELDKLDKLPKKTVADSLKVLGAEGVLKVIDKGDFSKYKFFEEIRDLIRLCKVYGVELKFSPTLARGLSYYNGIVFEVKTEKMKETICGGGAYMVEGVQAFGFAFGLDRLCVLSNISGDVAKVLVLSLGQDEASIDLVKNLRRRGVFVNFLMDRTVSKGLEYANSKGIERVVLVGDSEVSERKFLFKDMKSGKESKVSEDEILDMLG